MTLLAEQGVAVTTGTEGSVGLAGATLGGGFGFGFLTRYLGTAGDGLVGAEAVVASGTDRTEAVRVGLGLPAPRRAVLRRARRAEHPTGGTPAGRPDSHRRDDEGLLVSGENRTYRAKAVKHPE
ncbi:hypothetical protein [Streptomyces sp. NPDC047718]|uniref:hypothetical protein n=1 Tax=Streptomyces sp. NPDC047718 TaxID=3155479 RepID=UPI0033C4AF8E